MRFMTVGNTEFAVQGLSEEDFRFSKQLFGWEMRDHANGTKSLWSITIASRDEAVPSEGDVIRLEYDERAVVYGRNPRKVLVMRTGGTVELDQSRRSVKIANGWSRGRFIDFYRVVRQVAVSELVNSGFVCLHASAVEKDGVVVAFAGPKGAGKTTHASRLASLPGWKWLANDKLFVNNKGEAFGIPEAPAVSQDWPSIFVRNEAKWREITELGPLASDIFFDHRRLPTWESVESGDLGKEKLLLADQELMALLGTTRSQGGILSCLWLIGKDIPLQSDGELAPRGALSNYFDALDSYSDWTALRAFSLDAATVEEIHARVRLLTRSGDVQNDVNRALTYLRGLPDHVSDKKVHEEMDGGS